jgi:hypothetical protein
LALAVVGVAGYAALRSNEHPITQPLAVPPSELGTVMPHTGALPSAEPDAEVKPKKHLRQRVLDIDSVPLQEEASTAEAGAEEDPASNADAGTRSPLRQRRTKSSATSNTTSDSGKAKATYEDFGF